MFMSLPSLRSESVSPTCSLTSDLRAGPGRGHGELCTATPTPQAHQQSGLSWKQRALPLKLQKAGKAE